MESDEWVRFRSSCVELGEWSQSGKWVWNSGLAVMDLEVELDVGLEVYPIDTVNDVTWGFS